MKKRILAYALSALMTFSVCATDKSVVSAEEINNDTVNEIVNELDAENDTEDSDAILEESLEEVAALTDQIQFTSTNFPDANFRSYLKSEYDGKTYGSVFSIDCCGKNIKSLKGIELFTNISTIVCENNQISELDLSKNLKLKYLYAENNKLTKLDVHNNTSLETIDVINGNQINTLDIRNLGNNIRLDHSYYMPGNMLNTLYINVGQQVFLSNKLTVTSSNNCISVVSMTDPRYNTTGTAIKGASKGISIVDLKESVNNTNKRFKVIVGSTAGLQLTGGNFPSELFPDAAFRNYLNSAYETTDYLNIRDIDVAGKSISSLKGIEYFPNIEMINCYNNPNLKEVDVSKNKEIIALFSEKCALEKVNVSGLKNLKYLTVGENKLSSIDLSTSSSLVYLSCECNQLTSLDISRCTNLATLISYNNKYGSLDTRSNTKLIRVEDNVSTRRRIDLTKNTSLKEFYLENSWAGATLNAIYMPVGMQIVVGKMGNLVSDNKSIATIGTGVDTRYNTSAHTIKAVKKGVCNVTVTDNYSREYTFKVYVGTEPDNRIPVLNSMTITANDNTGISGVLNVTNSNGRDDYRISYSVDNGATWITAKNWNSSNTFTIKPDKFGAMLIRAEMRIDGDNYNVTTKQQAIEYHPVIKGNCQMPYEMIAPGEPGYLIGLETYPGTAYEVEMLILDCTSMMWVYTTTPCGIVDNCLWTVWQPEYGYYWTLFRAYDRAGNLIDEVCYGFVNAY